MAPWQLVGLQAYRTVLALRDARNVVLLGALVRIPLWAANVVLVLHIVSHLDRSYAQAGFLEGVATVAVSISGPWRGRLLDRIGLRRSLLPALVVGAACWSVAPFVGYWALLPIATLAALFTVPTFSIVRQALLHAVPDDRRQAALSVDAIATELSFMVGPTLGVLLATSWATPQALLVCEFASLTGGLLLWLADPPLRAAEPAGSAPTGKAGLGWVNPAVVAVLAACLATTVVLTGTDVGVVAALRHMHHASWIGWELAVWGLGSAVGGLVYGALHKPIPAGVLLLLLAATTIPVGLAADAATLAVLLFVAGLFCAPTLTSTVDAMTRAAPARVRGEALGWHGSALTAGGALGAPVAGVAVDHWGWPGGFVLPACLGLVAGIVLLAVTVRALRATGDGGGRGAGSSGEQVAVSAQT